MKKIIQASLTFKGEAAFFLQMVNMQTGMSYQEIFSKMIDLYKQIYLSDKELAWVEGDVIKQKLTTLALKTKTDDI